MKDDARKLKEILEAQYARTHVFVTDEDVSKYDKGGWLPHAGPAEVVNPGPTQKLSRCKPMETQRRNNKEES